MAKKKKGSSGKRIAKREDKSAQSKDTQEAKKVQNEPTPPRIPERIQEKDSGFGVIKPKTKFSGVPARSFLKEIAYA